MKNAAAVILAATAWGSPIRAETGPQTLLVIEPTAERPRNSEGDLVELKDGTICLIYTRFSGGGADNASADLAARFSRDGGRSWSDDRLMVKNEGKENVMSVSILRLKDGELLLFYLMKNGWNDCNLYVRRSSDEFQTLSAPVRCTVADGYHVVNNDRVIELSSGRLLVPAALHPCPDGTRKTWTGKGILRAFLSDDGGRTWRADATMVSPVPEQPFTLQEPGALELKDGRIWMWCRTTHGCQYESFSSDGGVRWSAPKAGNLASPCSPATIERIPWTGDLLCVWNDHSGTHAFPAGKRTPLCAAISKDDGRTWSKSQIIEGDPNGWYCYTAMAFIKDRVLLAYCAGDSKVGHLNRLKVTALSRDWLYR
jgi:sialidase-1